MSLRRKQDATPAFSEVSDERLRFMLADVRDRIRDVRRAHPGPDRDEALERADRLEALAHSEAADTLRRLGLEGTASALGMPSYPIGPLAREAILLDAALQSGFFERLRESIKKSTGFCALSAKELAELIEPLAAEADGIQVELDRRYREGEELRRQLRELEAIQVAAPAV